MNRMGLIGRCLGMALVVGGCEEAYNSGNSLPTSTGLAIVGTAADYAATNPNADYTLEQRQHFAVSGTLLRTLSQNEAVKEAARENRVNVNVYVNNDGNNYNRNNKRKKIVYKPNNMIWEYAVHENGDECLHRVYPKRFLGGTIVKYRGTENIYEYIEKDGEEFQTNTFSIR